MRLALTFSLATAAALAACAHKPAVEPAPPRRAPAPAPSLASPDVKVTESYFGRTKAAVATLTPNATSGVGGIVVFAGGGTSVDVHVMAAGLQPGSIHAFHVHEAATARAPIHERRRPLQPDAQAARPAGQAAPRRDMPSLLADPAGKIDARFTLEGVTLGGTEGFVGHAVILHAVADDYDAQPTGNSGARIACGVIAAQ